MLKRWFILALAGIASLAATANAQTADIEYFEAPTATWDGMPKSALPPEGLKFRAFNRDFDLQLEINDGVLSALDKEKSSRAKSNAWYAEGSWRGHPGSWVRISRVGDDFFGAIHDGTTMYLLDPGWAIGVPSASLVVYRASDLKRPHGEDEVLLPPTVKQDVRSTDLEKAIAPKSASQRLYVSIVGDEQFTSNNPDNGTAAVMARMNIVDGIFSEQVGVELFVSNITLLTDNGVMTSTDPSDVLREFVDYYRSSSLEQPGLAHLFSGKNFDGNVVGVAYLGVLCSSGYGYGISETRRSGSSGALTVAHEIGHNFDAPHDNSSSCESDTTRGIMNSSLNGSQQFSQCSLDFMAQEVSRAYCLVDVDDIFAGTFE